MPSESVRTALDLGIAVLAGIVLFGAFGLDVDGTGVGAVAVLAAAVTVALFATDAWSSVVLAAGVFGGYTLGLSLVGPNLGWVYPAPSLWILVGATGLLAVPLGTLTHAGRRRVLDGDATFDTASAAVTGLATVGSGLFLFGLPRTLWPLFSWPLVGAAGAGITCLGVATVRWPPTEVDGRDLLRRLVAVVALGLYGLVVIALLALGTVVGFFFVILLPEGTSIAWYPVVAALALVGIEAGTASTIPAVRLADRVDLAPGFTWPPYEHRRQLVAAAIALPTAVAAVATHPPTTPPERTELPVLIVTAAVAATYAGVLSLSRK